LINYKLIIKNTNDYSNYNNYINKCDDEDEDDDIDFSFINNVKIDINTNK